MMYQVNQYKMPFAPFTGVHHHKQSVVFGGALLADATESTFTWLFTSWLKAMSGWQPGFIITDYDSAITTAVQIANCSCKMFEFEGILCRHVIAAFRQLALCFHSIIF